MNARTQYETDADLEAEKAMMKIAYPDRTPIKLPRSYHADFWLPHTKLPPVVVECKRRSANFEEYETYAISLGKFMNCRRLARVMGGFFDIVVQWGDGVIAQAHILDMQEKTQYAIKPGGRTDRNDPADFEPMVHIPNCSFKVVGKSDNT